MNDWITIDKTSGEGNSKVHATVAPNESKDRTAELMIRTAKNTVVRMNMINPGKREEFHTKDGILICSDANEFLTLKN